MFVWIFYELLYTILHKHHVFSEIYKEFSLMGIDATSIKLDLPFATYGHYSLTNTIEKGIKVHRGALLCRFTIPLTAMVTPMDVNDSDEFDDVLIDAGMLIDLQKVILVFDKGYWSLTRFEYLTAKNIRFITRLKKGVKYTVLSTKKGAKWEDMEIEFTSLQGLRLRLVTIYSSNDSYLTNDWNITHRDSSLLRAEVGHGDPEQRSKIKSFRFLLED